MLADAAAHGWDGPRISNTELTEVTEVHGDGLDRRGAALRAAGTEVRPGS